MSRNILIFGDSNVHHFTFFYEENGNKPIPSAKPTEYFKRIKLLDDNITCIWKYSSSGIKFSDDYIYRKSKEYSIKLSDHDFIIYQFGNIDVKDKLNSLSDIPEFVDKYVNSAIKFANKNNLIPVFTSPIVHKDLIDVETLKIYIKELKRYCEEKSVVFVDVYDIIDNNYEYYSWDVWKHLDEPGSKMVLEHILINMA